MIETLIKPCDMKVGDIVQLFNREDRLGYFKDNVVVRVVGNLVYLNRPYIQMDGDVVTVRVEEYALTLTDTRRVWLFKGRSV